MKRIIYISLFIAGLSLNLKAQDIQLDTLVNIKFEEVTLKQALNEISEQYELNFSYSDSKIRVNDTINSTFNSTSLSKVLKTLLHGNDINYNIIGNQIVLFPFNTNQTIIIRGKVVDKTTSLPIPYANISLSGTQKGTSSNEEGEFQLALTKLPFELLISHLSHEKKLVYVYDDTREIIIEIEPTLTTLEGITVSAKRNKKSNIHLIKKAYNLLSKSKTDLKYGKAFYRQKSQRENKYTEIFEMFYDIKYSANGIEDWAVQEGRYAFQSDEEYDIFLYNKNFTLLSRLFPVQQPTTDSYLTPVNPDVKKLFELELKDIMKFDERLIAVISFTPKAGISTPIARGELYIDLDNYQVLKMKGTFSNKDLNIISFSDANSNWENYLLDFEISFIDDQSGQLLLDFVQINHQFDYYFKKEHIGKIKTSSILTFYEHYTPAKNKKLGRAINYAQGDIDIIDGVGYNSSFWSQNPIVKRTPLEEKLIKDFERNEAFGVVFMNNEDKVVLLPDKQNTEKAKAIISRFEAENVALQDQLLFLRLDKENYQIDENIRFSAYVLDRWLLKPFVYGSVLFIEIFDNNNQLIIQHKFDINNGMSYGEINLSEITNTGLYRLKAYTNANKENPFEKNISLSHYPTQLEDKSLKIQEYANADATVEFFPESGNLLNDVNTKIIFCAHSKDGIPIKALWQIITEQGQILKTIKSNRLGLGSFDFTAKKGGKFYLEAMDQTVHHQWVIPTGKDHGFSIKIHKDQTRSILAELNLKPAIPQEIYLLSTAGGKVFSFYEKMLHASTTKIDLPLAHLPEGVNSLIAMDKSGKLLAQRSFFVQPEKLNIELESVVWKSKRSNRVKLNLKITNQDGSPVIANLSAICSSSGQNCVEHCDIRNYLYFGNDAKLSEVDLDHKKDSVLTHINEILIVNDTDKNHLNPSMKSEVDHDAKSDNLANILNIEESVVSEISVSSNFTGKTTANSKKQLKQQNRNATKNTTYWIPEIDEQGSAQIEYKLDSRNKSFYVNIQGVSYQGQVGNQTFRIDPHMISSKKGLE